MSYHGTPVATTRVIVTAKDRRGKPLSLPAIRASYDEATASRPGRPTLAFGASHRGPGAIAEALGSAKLARRGSAAAFATLLQGLLEVSRRHRHLELFVETPGEAGSPFQRGVGIFRGNFDRERAAIDGWLELLASKGGRARLPTTVPVPGAERLGELGELATMLEGLPWAIAWAGAVYVKDGPETARRVTPPGRFSPATWSADGERLAILGRTEGGEPSLWLSHRGGGALSPMALEAPGTPTAAAFSLQGNWIAVTTSAGRLVVLSVDGNSSAAIPVGPKLRLFDPAWSPDSKLVACIAEEVSGRRSLQLVSIDVDAHQGARLFSGDPAGEDLALADPEFSEDGNSVFVRGRSGGEPRLLRIPVQGGPAETVGPRLSRVKLKGGGSRWRKGKLFVAGVGDVERADAEWVALAGGESVGSPGTELEFAL